MTRPARQSDVVSLERERQAVELRKRGFSYDEIAVKIGMHGRSGPWRAVKRAMTKINSEVVESVAELRDLEVSRLDRALVEISKIAFDRTLSPERRLNGAEALRRNVESRVRLLGLASPERVELITTDSLERRIAELSHELGVPLPRELIEPSRWDLNIDDDQDEPGD